jgi:hypothetical protein
MSLSKQITNCQIMIYQSDGTTPVSGYPKNVSLYSGSITLTPYYLTGSAFDEALSGKLRTQLGGYRASIQLGWERLGNTANLLNIVKDARVTSYRPRITFAPDAATATSNFNVVISDVNWSAAIESQITRQPISVRMTGQDVLTEIPAYLVFANP